MRSVSFVPSPGAARRNCRANHRSRPHSRRSEKTMLTLIEHGELYAPQPLGRRNILIAGSSIHAIGDIARTSIKSLDAQVLDASDCYVLPGFIDPHAHLIGAGGEQGFSSRMPEISFDSFALAGV